MAIGNMQQAQQLRANGGIMTIPRQKYGLGKLVKKAFKGVKKIAKSPIGKAAITAGLMGAPFGGGTWFGSGSGWGKLSGGGNYVSLANGETKIIKMRKLKK